MQRRLLGIAIDSFWHSSMWGSFMVSTEFSVLYALEQMIQTLLIIREVLKIHPSWDLSYGDYDILIQ